MALLGHGGKSRVETTSSASTRPCASAKGKRSRWVIGVAAAISSKRSNATSTAIRAPALPGLPTGFTRRRLFQMGHEVTRTMPRIQLRSEEHTSELQSLMRISYAVFCLKKNNTQQYTST